MNTRHWVGLALAYALMVGTLLYADRKWKATVGVACHVALSRTPGDSLLVYRLQPACRR